MRDKVESSCRTYIQRGHVPLGQIFMCVGFGLSNFDKRSILSLRNPTLVERSSQYFEGGQYFLAFILWCK